MVRAFVRGRREIAIKGAVLLCQCVGCESFPPPGGPRDALKTRTLVYFFVWTGSMFKRVHTLFIHLVLTPLPGAVDLY